MGCNILSSYSTLQPFLEEGNPESRYKNLEQIGHGNFGAVYCAQDCTSNQTVAIKKIFIVKKEAETRINDISTELKVLTSLNHENIVGLKTAFFINSNVWIVMEYCLGSLVDMLVTLSAPFSESIISYVAKSVLTALEYIHSLNWIHRDVKAANILISRDETVKLGDFGSTSLKNPTNTFTGSPYWMAPEVILAMEDGEYCVLCDIWSLGITCIELAETKPPRFEKNAMSALYFIAQNDSPKLSCSEKWSISFNNFVKLCLIKEVKSRPDSKTMMEDEFLTLHSNGAKEFSSLINDCFSEVEAKNSSNYRKLKCFVDLIDSEGTSNESDTQLSSPSTKDEIFKRSSTLVNNVNTFKTTSTVVQESLMRENDFFQSHLNNYRLIRKHFNKQLDSLVQKLKIARADIKRSNEKIIDSKCQAVERQIDKTKSKMSVDYEQLLKGFVQEEKKLTKSYNATQRKHVKSTNFKSSKPIDANQIKEILKLRAKQSFELSLFVQQAMIDLIKYEKEERLKLLNERKSFYEEELDMLDEHLLQIDALKMSHISQIHSVEISGFAAYVKKCELQLNKKHLYELKMKPKELKSCENLLKKEHGERVRNESSRYKRRILELQGTVSREEFHNFKRMLKRERTVMLTKLENEYTETLAKKLTEIELSYGSTQQKEVTDMKAKSSAEYEQFKNYQSLIKNSLITKLAKNRDAFKKSNKALMDEYIETYNSQIEEIELISDQKLKQIDEEHINSCLEYEEWTKNSSNVAKNLPKSAQATLSEHLKSGKENKPWSIL